MNRMKLFAPLLAIFCLAACGAADETGPTEASPAVAQSSALIESCNDWNGTCQGLPEGSACGTNGTCVADTYGVYGFCTCWEQSPPAYICPSGSSCAGLEEGSSCRRRNGTWGTCVAYNGGTSNVPTNCMCF